MSTINRKLSRGKGLSILRKICTISNRISNCNSFCPYASTCYTHPFATAQQPSLKGTSENLKMFESEKSPPPLEGVGGWSTDAHLPLTTHYSLLTNSSFNLGVVLNSLWDVNCVIKLSLMHTFG